LKKIVLLFLLIIHFNCIAKQNNDSLPNIILLYTPIKETFFVSGINLNRYTAIDNMVSPLVYDGYGLGANFGLLRQKSKSNTNLNFSFCSAKLNNELQAKHYATELNHMLMNCGKSYEINNLTFNTIVTSIGWQFNQVLYFKSNSQFQNSSLTYHISSAISPVFRFEKYLSIKENKKRLAFKKQRYMRINYQFSIPILGAIARPNYNVIRKLNDGTGSNYENSLASEVISNYKLYSFKSFFAINSILCLEYYFKNGNRFMLQYYFNFEQMKKEHFSYKVAQSGLQFCLLTRLNSN